MGASNFSLSYVGKNVQEAYKDAVADALYEYGHDPYNGTISTTHGFHLFDKKDHPRYGTKAFSKWEDEILGEKGRRLGIEKWLKAAAVEVPRSIMLKHRPNLKGKRVKEFYFFGWAAE